MSEWIGFGSWAGWKITSDHAASSYGQPVLVDPTGKAYGPGDIGAARPLFRAADIARELKISRGAVTQLRDAARKPGYRGNFPAEVSEGLWDPNEVETYRQIREASAE